MSYLIILILTVFLGTQNAVESINCYQCSGTDSAHPFECNEFLSSDNTLEAKNCSSIHEAQFCIKHVGRYEAANKEILECFQCSSSESMECGDGLMHLDGGIITPTPCSHVYEPKHCIKQTGGISTKRFCSSLDLGNYCHYVQQPGDKLSYRTCIYTCSTDGCNTSSNLRHAPFLLLIVLAKAFFNL